jgi:glycosyltransferase involved in cell wall biosynthesis
MFGEESMVVVECRDLEPNRGFYIFALPSYREEFPIASSEAQGCGLPLVTNAVTGCIDRQTL